LQWIFLLGVATGSRTMTAIAVLCWAAWLGALPEHGWAVWSAYLVSALIFTGMALGEYYGDTRPDTPSRKALFPALSRVAFGALAGALAATAIYQPVAGGVLDGAFGALFGTWAGYALRAAGARALKRDLPVALTESTVALALAIFAAWELHKEILFDLKRGAV
jgi:uncharacterized membrane protein